MGGLVGSLGERLLELLIGRVKGSGKPTKAQEAANAIYLPLSKVAGAPSHDDQRSIDEILEELATTTDLIEGILRYHGVGASKSRRDGNLTVDRIVYRLRDDIIAPRLDQWRPQLLAHLQNRPRGTPPLAWEAEWDQLDECRRALDSLRVDARPYLDTLAGLAGSRAAAERVPKPPNKVISGSRPTEYLAPEPGARPKQSMVRWFDPVGIAALIPAKRRADKSLAQIAETWAARKTESAHAPTADERAAGDGAADRATSITRRKWKSKYRGRYVDDAENDVIRSLGEADYENAKLHVKPPAPDGAADAAPDLWIDYVADMGDAIDPTLAVAWQLTEPAISLPTHRKGELPQPPHELPRGSLLVMGGDQVYPYASRKKYRNQLELPYRLAGDAAASAASASNPETDAVPVHRDDDGNTSRHQVVAIPGNHDWLGGIEQFETIFVESDTFAKHWRAPQLQRYWAIELIGKWWIWGIDTGLDDVMDQEQQAFFAGAAQDLDSDSQVIVCSPVPFWQLMQKRPEKYHALREQLDTWIGTNGARAPIWLAGDSHFFAQYRRVKEGEEQHITSGGGGAFLQPTHNLAEQLPSEDEDPFYKLGARWPRPIDSRDKAASLSGLGDRQFWLVFVLVGLLHTAYAALVRWGRGAGLSVDGAEGALRWVIGGWRGWPLLTVLALLVVAATTANSVEKDLRRGARRYGAAHGAAQAAIMVLVATVSTWTADTPLSVYVVGPLIGGFVATAVAVSATRAINARIKANDTVAYSPAHGSGYKHFVRMRISPSGDLSVYVIGIDPVGRGWYQALTGRDPRRAPFALAARSFKMLAGQFKPHIDDAHRAPAIPPAEGHERSRLHYLWGVEIRAGSETRVRLLETERGDDHPETIRARAAWAAKLSEKGNISEAVEALTKNLDACEARFGATSPETSEARAALVDSLIAGADLKGAERELRELVALADPPNVPATEAAARRVRCVAAISALDDQAATELIESWAAAHAEPGDDWRMAVVALLRADAQVLGPADHRPPVLAARWNADTDSGLIALREEIAAAPREAGLRIEGTILARRFVASKLVEPAQRDEALNLLKQNGDDRLSLAARRHLAGKRSVVELRELRDEAAAVAGRDRGAKASLLAPIWIDLAWAMHHSGETDDAIAELEQCWDATKPSRDVLTALNEVRAAVGKPEWKPDIALADDGGSARSTITNFNIGVGESAGPTGARKSLAAIGSAVVGIVVTGATLFNPFGTENAETSSTCQQLSGLLNVGVLDFAVPRDDPVAMTAADFAVESLLGSLDPVASGATMAGNAVGFCERTTDGELEPDEFEELAEELQADVIITATLDRDGIIGAEPGNARFSPQFYVPEQKLGQATELAGLYALGDPVIFSTGFGGSSPRGQMEAAIEARSTALISFVGALSAYEEALASRDRAVVDELTVAQQAANRAVSEFAKAQSGFARVVADPECNASTAPAEALGELGVLAYVFLGNVYWVTHTRADDRAVALERAARCYAQAKATGTSSPRPFFGAAEVQYWQMRSSCGSVQDAPSDDDRVRIQAAYDGYNAGFGLYSAQIAAGIRPPDPSLESQSYFRRGRVALCASRLGVLNIALSVADFEVVIELTNGETSTLSTRLAIEARRGLADIALDGHHDLVSLDTAERYLSEAIDLARGTTIAAVIVSERAEVQRAQLD